MNRYTKEGRLSDVIALISLLSVDMYAFRTISNLEDALRADPKSVKTKKWGDIAAAHPEFFRFNGARDNIALLIRSYFPEDAQHHRATLSVSETQKLIDTAIALHDKEIALKQRYSYLYSFWGSLLVATIAVSGTIYNTVSINKSNGVVTEKLDSLISKTQRIVYRIDKNGH